MSITKSIRISVVTVTVSHGHPAGTGYILVTMTKLNNRTCVYISSVKN